jgi:DMSO reductase anchor subunit
MMLENLVLTLALGAIGMLGAIGHVSSPLRAPRAILNWRCSWLSREILLSVAFVGMVFLAGLIYLLPDLVGSASDLSALVADGLRVLAGLTGLALLGAMSMSYLVPTRPVWNHHDTSASFYAGAFQLGWVVSAALLFVRVQRIEAAPLVLIACGLIVLTLLRIYIILRVVERLRGLNVYRDQPHSWLTGRTRQIRIILAVVGGVVAPLFSVAVIFLPETFSATVTEGIWIIAALLLFVGEGIDRWVFFEASPSVIFPPRF